MSKLVCDCGYIVVDQTDNLSYKARFIRDQDGEKLYGFIKDITKFIEAIKNGKRSEYIHDYFSDDYPKDLDDESIISDITTKYAGAYESNIYQCDNCGRILMQIEGENRYASFKPEDGDNKEINYKDIFRRIQK